jgi:Holliday junction resolvasome RuvABC endonuclease subunit
VICLGIDVATTKLAIGGIREDGSVVYHVGALPVGTGSRRLLAGLDITHAMLHPYRIDAAVIVVEIPWARASSSFALLSMAGIAMAGAQQTCPGAVVIDAPTPSWKLGSVGHGNATKAEVLAHANAIGYEGIDQDCADAVCMAQFAWTRWDQRTEVA